MAVTLYQSSDAGSPTLTGEAGSLVNLLTQVLVNGYGSKSGAGWTKPYTGTAKAVFRAGTGGQAYLWVDDNAPGGAGAREARVRGYESMTAIDVGTGAFPTTTQMTVPIICRKSASQDSVTRPWIVVADDKRFYLFVATGDSTTRCSGFYFGDITSYKVGGDAYGAAIIGRTTENNSTEPVDALSAVASTVSASVAAGHYLARSHTGIGSSKAFTKLHDSSKTQGSYIGSNQYMAYPNQVDGGLYMSPVWVCYDSILRGHMPGFWAPMHTRPLTHLDTFAGQGNLSGKAFMAIDLFNSAQCFIEISDTW